MVRASETYLTKRVLKDSDCARSCAQLWWIDGYSQSSELCLYKRHLSFFGQGCDGSSECSRQAFTRVSAIIFPGTFYFSYALKESSTDCREVGTNVQNSVFAQQYSSQPLPFQELLEVGCLVARRDKYD